MAFIAKPSFVLGCDVGKDSVAVFNSKKGKRSTWANDPASLEQALQDALADLPEDGLPESLLVCEATGGYEAALLAAAHAAGLACHRADTRKASAFVRSLNSHAKNDALDAKALALYGLERGGRLPRWQPASTAQIRLTALVQLRGDLVGCLSDWRRRLKAPGADPVSSHLQAVLDDLEARLAAVEADIAALIDADRGLAAKTAVIQAIPGCGSVTAATLAALMPELGQIDRKQAASLAGLAPHPRQSGQADAYRSTRGGRRPVKTVLFMAAMTARRYNPDLKAFYERLITNGKKRIVAIIAVARKLITIINARIRDAAMLNPQQLC